MMWVGWWWAVGGAIRASLAYPELYYTGYTKRGCRFVPCEDNVLSEESLPSGDDRTSRGPTSYRTQDLYPTLCIRHKGLNPEWSTLEGIRKVMFGPRWRANLSRSNSAAHEKSALKNTNAKNAHTEKLWAAILDQIKKLTIFFFFFNFCTGT